MRLRSTSSLGYRTLPIRRWLALALAATILVPIFVTVIVGLSMFYKTFYAQDRAPQILREGAAHWTQPAWQAKERAALVPYGVDFVLVVGSHVVYRTLPDPLARADAPHKITVERLMIKGTPRKIAYIYTGGGGPVTSPWLIPVALLVALILTLTGIAWFLRRTLIVPLAAASGATRRIAASELNIKLPKSRVREVAQLNAAFLQMSDELQASLRRQAAIEEERRLFVSAIAHDLRTPLFSLRGYLEGLEQGVATTPEKVARYIQVCREKADALERLIADLFAYAKVEYLEGTLQRAPLDLGVLLRRVADGRQRDAATNRVTLDADGPAQPCVVEGDEQLLGRTVENLLDNALRYTPENGRIEIRWWLRENLVQFTVADTGAGIAPRDLPHLFEPMYRSDPSRSRETGGTGLGLAIARRILRAHGGDLVAANSPDGGAVFTGSVPLLQGVSQGVEPAAEDRMKVGQAQER